MVLYCIFAGALGGLLKSLLEHNGNIMFPELRKGDCGSYLALGSLVDILGGGAIGWISTNQWVLDLFSVDSYNFAFSFVMGLLWITVLESLANRIYPDSKGLDGNDKDLKPETEVKFISDNPQPGWVRKSKKKKHTALYPVLMTGFVPRLTMNEKNEIKGKGELLWH